eukprot:8968097-Pyramimonas_sp.AAC.1
MSSTSVPAMTSLTVHRQEPRTAHFACKSASKERASGSISREKNAPTELILGTGGEPSTRLPPGTS